MILIGNSHEGHHQYLLSNRVQHLLQHLQSVSMYKKGTVLQQQSTNQKFKFDAKGLQSILCSQFLT